MKVWELEENKKYDCLGTIYKVENGYLKCLLYGEWKESTLTWNNLKDHEFEEEVGINNHWKPKEKELFLTINDGFNGTYLFERGVEDETVSNIFHVDDKKKVECLALEFKIKSVLLNWRRLHDNVELDKHKWYLTKAEDGNRLIMKLDNINLSLGAFSSMKKTEKFYDYMKNDIDKYFKMRKELKF